MYQYASIVMVVLLLLCLTIDTTEDEERWSCVYETKMLPEEPHWDGDDNTEGIIDREGAKSR